MSRPLEGKWTALVGPRGGAKHPITNIISGTASRWTDDYSGASLAAKIDCCPDEITPLSSWLEWWCDDAKWWEGPIVEPIRISMQAGILEISAVDPTWLAMRSPALALELSGSAAEQIRTMWGWAQSYQHGFPPAVIVSDDGFGPVSEFDRTSINEGHFRSLGDEWLDWTYVPGALLVGSPRLRTDGPIIYLSEESFVGSPAISWQTDAVVTSAAVAWDEDGVEGVEVAGTRQPWGGIHVAESARNQADAKALARRLINPYPHVGVDLAGGSLSSSVDVDVCTLLPGRKVTISHSCLPHPSTQIISHIDVRIGLGGKEESVTIQTVGDLR